MHPIAVHWAAEVRREDLQRDADRQRRMDPAHGRPPRARIPWPPGRRPAPPMLRLRPVPDVGRAASPMGFDGAASPMGLDEAASPQGLDGAALPQGLDGAASPQPPTFSGAATCGGPQPPHVPR